MSTRSWSPSSQRLLHPLISCNIRGVAAVPAMETALVTPFPLHLLRLSSPISPSPRFHLRSSAPPPRRSSRLLPLRSTASPAVGAADEPAAASSPEAFDWYSQWYPVAPVCDLDKRRPHARRVMGLDLVVWWDRGEGQWRVFDDRCPHRLAPLSEGRIDQWGRLQCVYHGWCFDGEGSCKFIPQEPPEGPKFHSFKKACAAAYPSFEQNKIVWFWPSIDSQYKDVYIEKKPPYIPELDDPSFSSPLVARDLPYGYEVLIENIMDPAHVPYAHYGIMGLPPKDKSKFRDREGGKPINIKILNMDKEGFSAMQDDRFGKFIAPCLYYQYLTSNPGMSNGSESVEKNMQSAITKKERQVLLVFICIPVSPGRSRLIFSFPRNFAMWIDKIIPQWYFHLTNNRILDSDLNLLHLEEKKIAVVGPSKWTKACFVPTTSDALVVSFRKWLNVYSNSSNNQVDWANRFQPILPPTPTREQLMDRYWSHVNQCRSCSRALKALKALKVALQAGPILFIGIAAVRQQTLSILTRSGLVSAAVLCFLASKWLSHFIYKNFYFHDYDHALL